VEVELHSFLNMATGRTSVVSFTLYPQYPPSQRLGECEPVWMPWRTGTSLATQGNLSMILRLSSP